MEFNFTVTGDRLRPDKSYTGVTGNVNTYVCNFTFSKEYDDLAKFAVFANGEEYYTQEIKDNTCSMPHEAVLNEGIIQVGVFATNALAEDFKRISTNYIGINVETGAYSIYSQPKTPDVWESYLLDVIKERETAQKAAGIAARTAAEEAILETKAGVDEIKKECREATDAANAAAERVTDPLSAENISFDNSATYLESTNTGDAITELAGLQQASADGVNENKQAIEANGGAIAKTNQKLSDEREASNLLFANALKGTASGEVICVNDVSPVLHNVKVSVREESIEPGMVTVKVCGRNMLPFAAGKIIQTVNGLTAKWNEDGSVSVTGSATETVSTTMAIYNVARVEEGATIPLLKGQKYRLTVWKDGEVVTELFGTSGYYYPEDDTEVKVDYETPSLINGVERTVQYNLQRVYLQSAELPAGDTSWCGTYRFQLEVDGRTEDVGKVYEPYIDGGVYIPNADGSVDDVKSISPTMTLTTDTEGAIIDLEYNKDLNKVIEEITNAIISLGGNV